jgi:hypothetical protein
VRAAQRELAIALLVVHGRDDAVSVAVRPCLEQAADALAALGDDNAAALSADNAARAPGGEFFGGGERR